LGDVELTAEGSVEALQLLREWCRTGPPAASVTRIDEHWLESGPGLAGFEIQR
jgi:acylphosphatase